MKQYLDLLRDVRTNGVLKPTRAVLRSTGKTVDVLSVFGRQMRFDLRDGFPLVTSKFTSFDAIAHELIWFLSGSTNVKYLVDNGVNIWNEWCDGNGELGPVYGAQWRSWKSNDGRSIDQVRRLVDGIYHVKENPCSGEGRRLILSAWNVGDIPRMALPPCHFSSTFNVTNGKLSCSTKIRSNDLFLGAPFNIACYALLTHILAHTTGLGVGDLIYVIDDAHIYCNHLEQVDEQLAREPLPLPELRINQNLGDIDSVERRDLLLMGYKSLGRLKGEVAV